MEGKESQMQWYRYISPVIDVFRYFLFIAILIKRPSYCAARPDIDGNCEWEGNIKIIRAQIPVVASPAIDMLIPLSYCYLAGMRIWKYRMIKRSWEEFTVCSLLVTLIGLFVAMKAMKALNIASLQIGDIIIMCFILVYHDSVRNCVKRMASICSMGFEVIMVYIIVSFFYACLNRITFYDIPNATLQDQDPHIYLTFSNSSLWRALQTIWVAFPASNFPGFMLVINTQSSWKSW